MTRFPEAIRILREAALYDARQGTTFQLESDFIGVLDQLLKQLSNDSHDGFSSEDVEDIEKTLFEDGDMPLHLNMGEKMLEQGYLVAGKWSIQPFYGEYEDSDPTLQLYVDGRPLESAGVTTLRELIKLYGLDSKLRGWSFHKGMEQ